jgi:predicted membrane channel-forming protein YqfA (hemolysin III family)
MTNLSDEHRVERRSLSAGQFLVLALLGVVALVVVCRILDWLGDVASMVLVVAVAVVLAGVAWFDRG